MEDFNYLNENDIYLDTACQSLRPLPVIEALDNYYKNYNSCGERVKYKWGRLTDEKVSETRLALLKYLKLKPKDHFVSFTLNTTYGINLILNQIKPELFNKIITTDIEHNSPFLATMAFSDQNNIPREVLVRNEDGSIKLDECDFKNAIVVANTISNIDGRELSNLKELIEKVHKNNGIIIIDAAQTMAHHAEILQKTDADVICGSAHKMYAPSLGFIVAKNNIVEKLKYNFVGGGMVDDVLKEKAKFSATNLDHLYTRFEPGLQLWGEIIAFGEAIKWLQKIPKDNQKILKNNSQELYNFLNDNPKIHLINKAPNATISFYVEGIDSHIVAEALALKNIMCRAGYFCVHYYLDHVMHYPPLVRFSLGYHNRPEDIEKTIATLKRVTK